MFEDNICNPRYPHTITITRVGEPVRGVDADPDDPLAAESADCCCGVLYDGPGRSFTDTTTNGGVEVDLNKRKASIPVRYDEWGAGRRPLDGDTIRAVVGRNEETGRVRDCEPDNNRTLVYWDFTRV